MSSGNLIRVAFIPETVYGQTPVAGNFSTARFTSETLSGSPQTVESRQIRVDRMSSGQIVTGLQVQGALAIELAKEAALDSFLESVLYSTWNTLALVTVGLSYDATLKTLTRTSGSWSPSIVKGDILTLGGFSTSANNTQVMVGEVQSATVLKLITPFGMVTEIGVGTTYKRADKLVIGSTKKSFSMEKAFLDLTEKAITYKGMICSTMELSVAYGELVTGSIGFLGNKHDELDVAADFLTFGRAINPAATTDTFNGSIDMPFFASSALGAFEVSDFDVRSIGLNLDNGLTAQTIIGRVEPKDYSPGTCKIEVDLTAYLTNNSWQVLGKKLTQEPFSIGFMVKNLGGWHGFFLPAVQVSFDDPATSGQNQDILLNMSGQAKVGALGESSITIFRS